MKGVKKIVLLSEKVDLESEEAMIQEYLDYCEEKGYIPSAYHSLHEFVTLYPRQH